jgi:hypothetical protein
MSRKLKVIGLAALAVLAVSAVSASAAHAAQFTSEVEDTFLLGNQKTQSVFTTNAGEVKCEIAKFEGTMKGTADGGLGFTSQTAKVHPTYEKCTAFGFAEVTDTHACEFEFSASGTVSIVNCPSTAPITITIPSLGCNITIANQGPLSSVTYDNEGSGSTASILVTLNVTGITYTSSSLPCGPSGTNGTLTGSMTISAFSDAPHTHQVGIAWVP